MPEIIKITTPRRPESLHGDLLKKDLPKQAERVYLDAFHLTRSTATFDSMGDITQIMARITVEDCLTQVGNENRFSLIHLAVARVRQHRQGEPILAKGKNKEAVMTLREIAAGHVSFGNIGAFGKPQEDLAEKTGETEAPESEEVKASN